MLTLGALIAMILLLGWELFSVVMNTLEMLFPVLIAIALVVIV